jgi:hypothetical protein
MRASILRPGILTTRSHRRPVLTRRLGLALATGVMALSLFVSPVAAHNPNPRVLPPGSHALGGSYSDWGVGIWNWIFSIPGPSNPLLTANCNANQSGRVFFVTNTFFGNTLNESCAVNSGTWIFASAGGVECSQAEGNGTSEAELRTCVEGFKPLFSDIAIWIDGRQVRDIDAYWAESGLFIMHVVADNPFGIPAGDTISVTGNWGVLLPPLPVGVHTIVVQDTLGGQVAMTIATVTVSAGH